MWVRRGLIGVAVALVVAAGLVVADSVVYSGRIHPGVTVWGVEAGGLDVAGASRLLQERASRALTEPISASVGPLTHPLVPAAAGVRLDTDRTLERASAVADGGPWWRDLVKRLSLWVSPVEVPPALAVGERQAWASAVDDLALQVERLPRDARLIITEGGPRAVAGDEGIALDRDSLETAVLRAVAAGRTDVDAPTRVITPGVSTEQATRSLAAARLAFAAPVVLAYQGTTFSLTPSDLMGMAAVRPEGVGSESPLTFDTPAGRALLEERLRSVVQPPVDAVVVAREGGRGFTVVPSRDGTTVEWDALFGALTRAAGSTDRRYVPIPTAAKQPKLTTQDAEQLGVSREVASFTTYFSPSNAARVNNIRQVASLLDGVVIRPGETFSFNDVVGPRTKAAGFDEAPVIRDGILTPGVGGGICQVSTTLFNTAFFAGLPVVERHPHSFFIDHYPVGRDATVSYGEADLRFRNDTKSVLLLSVATTDHSVRVSLAAPQWDRVVEYDTSDLHDVVGPASSPAKPRRYRDPSLPAGAVSAVEAGIDGRSVDVTRTVKRPDGSVLFTDFFSSVYRPKDYVVRVGG